MTENSAFDLSDFTPYLLNMAAETAGLGFQKHYKRQYGLLRTEWRVLFHLGRHGPLMAKEICERARIHKTKVSRAVSAMERKRLLTRQTLKTDRRHEVLSLTKAGQSMFKELILAAKAFDDRLMADFSSTERSQLLDLLKRIAKFSKH